MFAGCAPGVFTIVSRSWFQSITGCPDSSAGLRVALLCGLVAAEALTARTAAAPIAPSATPMPNSRTEKRFMTVLLACVLLRASPPRCGRRTGRRRRARRACARGRSGRHRVPRRRRAAPSGGNAARSRSRPSGCRARGGSRRRVERIEPRLRPGSGLACAFQCVALDERLRSGAVDAVDAVEPAEDQVAVADRELVPVERARRRPRRAVALGVELAAV